MKMFSMELDGGYWSTEKNRFQHYFVFQSERPEICLIQLDNSLGPLWRTSIRTSYNSKFRYEKKKEETTGLSVRSGG